MHELIPIELAKLSDVRAEFLICRGEENVGDPVVVVRYAGTYRLGSAGNPDARYMEAMAIAGVAALCARAVVYDLTGLNYRWGDELERVFDVGSAIELPSAVVVGTGCEEAVRTLLLGEESTEPIERVGWIFRDLQEAIRYVVERSR